MAEYIDRDALVERWKRRLKYMVADEDGEYPINFKIVVDALEREPAADVVERKRGEWVDNCVRDWRCSECGGKIQKIRKIDGYCYDDKPNYCPDCGTDMRKDGEG